MSSPHAIWRDDIDALQFDAAGHGGVCLIHRLAFRRLLRDGMVAAQGRSPAADGGVHAAPAKTPAIDAGSPALPTAMSAVRASSPTAQDCLAFFGNHQAAFIAAARAKIGALAPGRNFHLHSRDVSRQLDMM